MTYASGSLVRARGRDWLVLPESNPAAYLLVLRPLGGSDDEITGVDTRLEAVESAKFALPDPGPGLGNHRTRGPARQVAGVEAGLAQVAGVEAGLEARPILCATRGNGTMVEDLGERAPPLATRLRSTIATGGKVGARSRWPSRRVLRRRLSAARRAQQCRGSSRTRLFYGRESFSSCEGYSGGVRRCPSLP